MTGRTCQDQARALALTHHGESSSNAPGRGSVEVSRSNRARASARFWRVSGAAQDQTHAARAVAADRDLIRPIALDVDQVLIGDQRVDESSREGLLQDESVVDAEHAIEARDVDQAKTDARMEVGLVRRAEPVGA